MAFDNQKSKQVKKTSLDISSEKKIPKGPIKFNLTLNEEQKQAKGIILEKRITILKGAAGSGKTALACQIALDQLFTKQVNKIIIARPLVTSGEELGFLPGGVAEKTKEFLIPIYDNMFQLYEKKHIEKLVQDGIIEICPLGMLRGRTYTNAFVIIDEAQNLTSKQLEGVMTRLGKGSRMVLVGDPSQCDLKDKKSAGHPIWKRFEGIPGFALITLTSNHRDPIVEDLLKVFDEFRD